MSLQPVYIFRGHTFAIHAIHFLPSNLHVLTGDATGTVIIWNLTTKRASAVWQAHTNSILGIGHWDGHKIITHGRDGRLNIWLLDEVALSPKELIPLPLDTHLTQSQPTQTPSPQLTHSIPCHTLNFCSFASVILPGETLLLALPGLIDNEIVLTTLPSSARHSKALSPGKRGMPMSLSLSLSLSLFTTETLLLLAGYEDGSTVLFTSPLTSPNWRVLSTHASHTQPVLSVVLGREAGFSSAADAVIARYALPKEGALPLDGSPEGKSRIVNTGHAGQQGLVIRDDGRILATAGWDGKLRVYSARTLKELGVGMWHREGCFAVGFAGVREEEGQGRHWVALGCKDGKVSLWEVY
ncbi:WD40 repeat-like protein [Piedraia hortae CBS 480.64]|uniref:ASTRA-associated protein 1 n=1 Tax=Piedraia hortae CBS 480.64 TaxID=1314780 RepID=A0A6A7C2M0_9PEZI|nr:WD40 repeat-like protein [Piedraia hortae CBS 480.64]